MELRSLTVGVDGKIRCFGGSLGHVEYGLYHDQEWCIPVHDEFKLFELLTLEGAQAGLSWETVLKRRESYRKAFLGFDPQKVSLMSDLDLSEILEFSGVIRHRLKILSVRKNAQAYLQIQKEHGSFDTYIWEFVAGHPIFNTWTSLQELPVKTTISDQISKDLQKRGMSFVGSTILYAYMQAIGMVNDHVKGCHCCPKTTS